MKGYLPQRPLIEKALAEQGVGGTSIYTFEKLGSTSHWLREQVTSSQQPQRGGQISLCVTDWQQAGVGRRGKPWQTLPGNITFSIYRESKLATSALMGLSLVTGIAVAKALQDALSITVKLKWPNDIIYNDAKLGGLLTEIISSVALRNPVSRLSEPVSSKDVTCGVISGIGINVRSDPAISTLGIGTTSLQAAGVELPRRNRDSLVGMLAVRVLASHRRFEAEGWSSFADQWKVFDWLADQAVNIHKETGVEQGIVRGVDHRGALLVESEGKLTPVFGGNVSIRPTV